jgi:hypothetical protein
MAPVAANNGGLLSALRKLPHTFPNRPDDRRMVAPAAQMISSSSIPATVHIYTFWDDRRQQPRHIDSNPWLMAVKHFGIGYRYALFALHS